METEGYLNIVGWVQCRRYRWSQTIGKQGRRNDNDVLYRGLLETVREMDKASERLARLLN